MCGVAPTFVLDKRSEVIKDLVNQIVDWAYDGKDLDKAIRNLFRVLYWTSGIGVLIMLVYFVFFLANPALAQNYWYVARIAAAMMMPFLATLLLAIANVQADTAARIGEVTLAITVLGSIIIGLVLILILFTGSVSGLQNTFQEVFR